MNPNLPEFIKYEEIPAFIELGGLESYLDRDLKVFEKIDGGNCQVRNIRGWNLVGGSRANFLKGPKAHVHLWFEKFLKWMYSNHSLYNIPQEIVLFGEWSGNHSIVYERKNIDKFFVIDVLDLESRRFIDYGLARELLDAKKVQGLNFLDELVSGKVDLQTVGRLLEEPSKYYSGNKEGLVIKDYRSDPQLFMKLYHPSASEKVPIETGGIDYLTPARYVKAVFRIMEERDIGKVRREEIVCEVVKDVMAEENICVRDAVVRKRLSRFLESGVLSSINKNIY